MAYVDENGLILIDEVEAFDDINKLKSALNSMEEALALVSQIASINSAFSGDTANAINYSSTELIKDVGIQKNEIEEGIKYITSLIDRYKMIDAKMKDQINSTLN